MNAVMISRLKKGAVRLILLFLLYFLQSDVFTHLKIHGICPLILPLAAVGFGIFEGGLTGGLWGLVSGIFCDISAGYSCTFTVFLTFVGFLSGFLSEFILARGFPSFITVSVITLILCALFQISPLIFNHSAALGALALPAAIQTLYSVLFLVPVYLAARGISRMR